MIDAVVSLEAQTKVGQEPNSGGLCKFQTGPFKNQVSTQKEKGSAVRKTQNITKDRRKKQRGY